MTDDRPQHVVRVPGSRRARLTPVPGTDPSPETGTSDEERPPPPASAGKGPNDQQLLRDVPPHY
ncbi:hypothetical protein [Microbacterium sp. OVT16B]|uniref:hypothetical protein n=1 Tax=Microbacterium sp. OVT16B TaxID=2862682 RepID=UPI001CBBBC00|nr:hypothetical protein [Microbacterium sp. OVT16B]